MKLELPFFVNIPKTGPSPPIYIVDYVEQFREPNDAHYGTQAMIEYLREQLVELTRIPRRFLENDNN